VYSILGFGEMIADRTRMQAYATALRDAVRPDSTVLDIGAGTGIMTLLACQYGARRVYAVEPSDAVALARETVRANGFSDRVLFFQALSTAITLPERADIAVADVRGVLPAFQGSLATLIDARERLLAPGGTLIPRADRLFAALLEDQKRFDEHVGIWESRPFGVDLHLASAYAVNKWAKARVTAEKLLSAPRPCAVLDYRALESPNFRGRANLTASRDGIAHGLLLWFDAELSADVSFSNAPGAPDLIYGQAYLPWPRAVSVRAGDTTALQVRADAVGDDYIWSWDCSIHLGRESNGPISFSQSGFFSEPLAAEKLRRTADAHVPTLNEDGQVDLFILQRMNGGQSLGEIAEELQAAFPQRFREVRTALTRAGVLSKTHSQ
jgi:type I protein arginine methyltransferase